MGKSWENKDGGHNLRYGYTEGSYPGFLVPSSNQTWQWNAMDKSLIYSICSTVPIKTSIFTAGEFSSLQRLIPGG